MGALREVTLVPMTINTKKLFMAGAVAIFVVALFQIFFEIVVGYTFKSFYKLVFVVVFHFL